MEFVLHPFLVTCPPHLTYDFFSFTFANLIIVLKEGQVVEQGTHDELMKMRGLYYSMWQQQALLEGSEETSPPHITNDYGSRSL